MLMRDCYCRSERGGRQGAIRFVERRWEAVGVVERQGTEGLCVRPARIVPIYCCMDYYRYFHCIQQQSSHSLQSFDLHAGMGREGRILFLGDTGRLLSSGFTNVSPLVQTSKQQQYFSFCLQKRCQEIMLFDTRNFGKPLHTEELGPSTG